MKMLNLTKEEIIEFLLLCDEHEQQFFPHPKKAAPMDYARWFIIAHIFGFKKIGWRIFYEDKSKQEKILHCLQSVNNDYTTVKSWIDSFIERIPIDKERQLACDWWQSILEGITPENFSMKVILQRANR